MSVLIIDSDCCGCRNCCDADFDFLLPVRIDRFFFQMRTKFFMQKSLMYDDFLIRFFTRPLRCDHTLFLCTYIQCGWSIFIGSDLSFHLTPCSTLQEKVFEAFMVSHDQFSVEKITFYSTVFFHKK